MSRNITDTKQKLIDTASELIWKSSYGAVSVDDICKAADVKKGSFYHFFPSKADLAIAAMEEFYQLKKGIYDGIFSPERPAAERFEKLADFVVQSQIEARAQHGRVCGCPHASLGSEMSAQDIGIRQKIDELTQRFERYYINAVRDMVAEGSLPPSTDVNAKSQEVYAYLMGQMMFARIQNDLEAMKRDLKPGLMRILGVKVKETEAA